MYLRLLRSGIVRVAFAVRNYAVCGGCFWSFLCVAGALVVSVLYVKVRRWGRRVLRENEDRLMMLVGEKDKQISQLLLQVSQMNEILSARRRVAVVRVGRLIASQPF
ncbi:SKI/DACH domain-containing protein [Actinidia chinensis var. chinensis]|uniref:SKI/DACH domain-containing protein n=1 Tax=Actinidia chinensis var. chinensis TaxID=1590841 RepID=A0A2R6P3X6_ACTCC|nr:SKI/DACH domain-containing protein [Actinidia chinensis var. chinensis]